MHEKVGVSANDLSEGDSGVEGRGVRRRKLDSAGKRRKRKGKNMVEFLGWE